MTGAAVVCASVRSREEKQEDGSVVRIVSGGRCRLGQVGRTMTTLSAVESLNLFVLPTACARGRPGTRQRIGCGNRRKTLR